jgi:toxin ParE1/3/4
MPRYVLAPAAERDIQQIVVWSHQQFGEHARLRYEALLARAIQDVFDAPERPGSASRPEIADGARTYHLGHSRDRVTVGRIRRARHFLLYRTHSDGQVEIGRVLHDSMDLRRHLPDNFGSGSLSE